ATLETARNSCEAQRASCTARADRATDDLAATRHELDEARATSTAMESARDQICTTAGEIVASVFQMRPRLPNAGTCVPASNARALSDLVASWRNGRSTLQRLEAFARGDTDVLPPMSPNRGEIDTLAQRLAGNNREPPLVYRRLLIEAVRSLA